MAKIHIPKEPEPKGTHWCPVCNLFYEEDTLHECRYVLRAEALRSKVEAVYNLSVKLSKALADRIDTTSRLEANAHYKSDVEYYEGQILAYRTSSDIINSVLEETLNEMRNVPETKTITIEH